MTGIFLHYNVVTRELEVFERHNRHDRKLTTFTEAFLKDENWRLFANFFNRTVGAEGAIPHEHTGGGEFHE